MAAQAPVGREEEKNVIALSMPLAQFKDRLPPRHIVAAVTIEEEDAPKAMLEEILRQPIEQVEVDARCRRERAGKVKVMVRVPQPQQRRKQRALLKPGRHPPHHLAEQQAIGKKRHVMSVLFECRHGKDHRRVLRQGGDGRPGKIGEIHARVLPEAFPLDKRTTCGIKVDGRTGSNGGGNCRTDAQIHRPMTNISFASTKTEISLPQAPGSPESW